MPRSPEAVKRELRQHIVGRYLPGEDPEQLTEDLELQTSGVLNSVNTLELVQHLETTYGISMTAHEIATRLSTVRSIAELVVEKAA
jgi:acyl carrier protein